MKELLWPAAMVSGRLMPVTVRPEPLALTWETVKAAEPLLVIVTDLEADWPSKTLPKLRLAGETLMPGCTPVPVRLNPGAAPGASLVMATVPPTWPVAVGAKFT